MDLTSSKMIVTLECRNKEIAEIGKSFLQCFPT
jgi:hypothetical protein